MIRTCAARLWLPIVASGTSVKTKPTYAALGTVPSSVATLENVLPPSSTVMESSGVSGAPFLGTSWAGTAADF